MTTKLHINLNQGLVEAEGSEEFVLKVYNDFKDRIGSAPSILQNTGQQNYPLASITTQHNAEKSVAPKKEPANKVAGTKKKSAAKGYSLCKDLNLYAEGQKPSLKDFIEKYSTDSNMPRYLLFTYYLKEIKGVEKVGINHIYTCFKNLGLKIPNIEQGLRDTSFRKGWLDNSNSEDLQIPVAGENAVGHELVKKQEAAA